MSELFINKKVWQAFTPEQTDAYVNDVFDLYRKKGFPYYPTDMESRTKEFNKLLRYDFSQLFDPETKAFRQTMHGLNLAWSYQPHSFGVRCGKLRTPIEAFEDDDIFKRVIRKRMVRGDNMSDSGIRKTLRVFTGTQGVSNFRPTAAAAIYKHFCPNGGKVWDMSSGYGGRLLGSYLAGVEYIGTEPCTLNYNGICQMNTDFNLGGTIHQLGSEVFRPEFESLDFCFTSPPYFNTEEYSDEETQSYIKYPTKELWRDGFLHDTMQNCMYGLKPGCCMAININNVKSYPTLEEDTISVAKQVGFEHIDTYYLALSKLNGYGFKYEPIFVFKKPLDVSHKECNNVSTLKGNDYEEPIAIS